MKATHQYLWRLKNNRFVDRFEEEIIFRPTTINDVNIACKRITELFKTHTKK